MAAAGVATLAGAATRMHKISDGVRLAYRVLSPSLSATPVVMIQGLSGVKEDWRSLAESLAVHRPVVVFDNRGMGESTADDAYFSVQDMADDAASLIKAQAWGPRPFDRVHVLGISMGGMIAQTLAVSAPELVDRLVLGCTHFGGPNVSPPSDAFINSFSVADFKRLGPVKYTARIQVHNYTPEWAAAPATRDTFDAIVKATLQQRRPFRIVTRQMGAIAGYSVEDELPKFKRDTLVVHGDADAVVPYANGVALAKKLPNSSLLTLSSCGHVFWDMDGGKSARAIAAFLESGHSAVATPPRSRL